MRPIWKTAFFSLLCLLSANALGHLGWNASAFSQATLPSNLASASGASLEEAIEGKFRERGVEILRARDWRESRLYEDPMLTVVVLDAPYTSIFGHRAKMEFLLIHNGRQTLIEAKRQRTSGSTDEKLPYVFENAKKNIALERKLLLVMDGDGWKPGAKDWIKARALETPGFAVVDFDEFDRWLDQELSDRTF